MVKIAIIGGGICGFSCAVQIKEHFNNSAEVTVISEEFTPNTTGDISAGLWSPFLCGNTSEEKIKRWSKKTHDFLHDIWVSPDRNIAGVCLIPVTRLTTEPQGIREYWNDIVFGFRKLDQHQLDRLRKEHERNYTDGVSFITFTSEPLKLLPYLMERYKKFGGLVKRQKVELLNEFVKTTNYDVVINCTGLGAKYFVPDSSMKAIRGQVIRVSAPWVREAIVDDSDDGNYIIPNSDTIVLGGTHQVDDYNITPYAEDREFIVKGCKKLMPSLEQSREIKELVGLRPGRDSVRLEKEVTKNGKIIIHNYGHGGSGVTLAWGCGADVLDLLVQNTRSKL